MRDSSISRLARKNSKRVVSLRRLLVKTLTQRKRHQKLNGKLWDLYLLQFCTMVAYLVMVVVFITIIPRVVLIARHLNILLLHLIHKLQILQLFSLQAPLQ